MIQIVCLALTNGSAAHGANHNSLIPDVGNENIEIGIMHREKKVQNIKSACRM
jgi:hypothetical protein